MTEISRVAVIGAGTMGAAIAGHLANSGRSVLLLDAVPNQLTPEEEAQGLGLGDAAVRNRLARKGLERIRRSRPPALFSPEVAERIAVGNVEDDLAQLADVDWVVEAVTERLEVKQALLERVDAVRRPETIVSSNTSGLPIAQIAEGRSPDFQAHFLGTHFFNPPRQMKLLEVTPIPTTRPEVLETICRVGERDLGKGIVLCKDTPNFVGNRVFTFDILFAVAHALDNGYTVEEVDLLTGPLIGRPRTATFRLLDLIGIDVMAMIAQNIYPRVPDDESREILRHPKLVRLLDEMLKRGWLGNKSGIGFYKTVNGANAREFWPLDLNTLEHRPPRPAAFAELSAIEKERDLPTRLRALVAREDRAGEYARAVLGNFLGYAARRLPEIADDVKSVDDAMRWGFNHALGPFEIWDALGIEEGARLAAAPGLPGGVPPWVAALRETGHGSFYQRPDDDPTADPSYWNVGLGRLARPAVSPHVVNLARSRANGLIAANEGASLVDLGEGVAALELHTKMNVLDERIVEMVNRALQDVATGFAALVVTGRGANFSAGANLASFARCIEVDDWAGLDRFIKGLQDMVTAVRFNWQPVIAAAQGWTLGGGCELAMATSAIVASVETYFGQPEINVGLLPAAGGCKEFLRRIVTPAAKDGDARAALDRAFDLLTIGQTSGSAEEARQWGLLQPGDRVIMNPDHLLAAARQEALTRANGYVPPSLGQTILSSGRSAREQLNGRAEEARQAGRLTAYDTVIAERIAWVLCGDEDTPTYVDEPTILDRERAAFVELCQHPETQERIRHFLQTGKPRKN